MPVNETLWLRDQLAAERLALEAVVVNARYPERFTPDERTTLAAARGHAGSPLAQAALGAAMSEQSRAAVQTEQLHRLRRGLEMSLIELPYLFAEQLGLPELQRLADALHAALPEPSPTHLNR
jgi:hypothetical protein